LVKLLEGVFQVGGASLSHPEDGSAYLIEDGGEAVLIDCGSHLGVNRLLKNIRSDGVPLGKIKLIVGTQGHFDHVEAASHLKRRHRGLELGMHEKDRSIVEKGDAVRTCANFYGERFHPTKVDLILRDGDEISVGSRVLRTFHLPGHTNGHLGLSVDVNGLSVLFAGSTLTGGFWLHSSNLAQWKRSLDRLLGMSFDLFTESHSDCVIYAYTKERLLKAKSAVLNEALTFLGMSPWPS